MKLGKRLEKPAILFGAGTIGRRALEYLGAENVYCFADNDPQKIGTTFCGKSVISFAEMAKCKDDFPIVPAISFAHSQHIFRQLEEHGITNYTDIKKIVFDHLPQDFSFPQLERFKNTHVGESCFLIGNGPSLRMEDLDLLHQNGAFTFASNRIYLAFGKTAWRPDILCCTDFKILEEYWHVYDAMTDVPSILLADGTAMLNGSIAKKGLTNPCISLFNMVLGYTSLHAKPGFSLDPSHYVFTGFTVIHAMIQWAVYMGFKKLYLLGCDTAYSDPLRKAKESNDYFTTGYVDNAVGINLAPPQDLLFLNYQVDEDASRRHGFCIYNATRGGALEVFERVDFDSLFSQ